MSPTEVYEGDQVTGTISTQNFNPKHSLTLTYKWSSTGGRVFGTGPTGTVDTTGLQPGSYTVTGTATDEKESTKVALVARTFVDTKDFPGAPHGEVKKAVTRETWQRPGCKCRSFQRGVHHLSVRQAIFPENPTGLIGFSVQIRAGS